MSNAYEELANEALCDLKVLHELENWFDSEEPRSSFQFGQALGTLDSDGKAAEQFSSWMRDGKCVNLVAGYLRGISERSGTLPGFWVKQLDDIVDCHPEYATCLTLESDIGRVGLKRILDVVRNGGVPATYLRGFCNTRWTAALGEKDKKQVLEETIRFEDGDLTVSVRVGLSLICAWSNYGDIPISEQLFEVSLRLLRAGLTVSIDASDWLLALEMVAKIDGKCAAEIGVEAITSPRFSDRVAVEESVLELLKSLASTQHEQIMEIIGKRLLDEETRPFFGIFHFPGLFEAIGLARIRDWLNAKGTQFAKYIARNLQSPYVDGDGRIQIPPLTDWILCEYENDELVFREFLAGRHSGEVTVGYARDRRAELEKVMQPFQNHQLEWVRRWAEYELRQNEWEAEMDDMMDERDRL